MQIIICIASSKNIRKDRGNTLRKQFSVLCVDFGTLNVWSVIICMFMSSNYHLYALVLKKKQTVTYIPKRFTTLNDVKRLCPSAICTPRRKYRTPRLKCRFQLTTAPYLDENSGRTTRVFSLQLTDSHVLCNALISSSALYLRSSREMKIAQ